MSSTFLRRVLFLDAATCALMGAALVFGAVQIAGLTALPVPLLQWAGLLLFPIAALMAFTGRQASPAPGLVWLIVAGNLGWAAASLAILGFGWAKPNLLGEVLVIGQAVAVLGLAALEFAGLRKAAPAIA